MEEETRKAKKTAGNVLLVVGIGNRTVDALSRVRGGIFSQYKGRGVMVTGWRKPGEGTVYPGLPTGLASPLVYEAIARGVRETAPDLPLYTDRQTAVELVRNELSGTMRTVLVDRPNDPDAFRRLIGDIEVDGTGKPVTPEPVVDFIDTPFPTNRCVYVVNGDSSLVRDFGADYAVVVPVDLLAPSYDDAKKLDGVLRTVMAVTGTVPVVTPVGGDTEDDVLYGMTKAYGTPMHRYGCDLTALGDKPLGGLLVTVSAQLYVTDPVVRKALYGYLKGCGDAPKAEWLGEDYLGDGEKNQGEGSADAK